MWLDTTCKWKKLWQTQASTCRVPADFKALFVSKENFGFCEKYH